MKSNDLELKKMAIMNIAWRACDTFRGKIDPSDYKAYILSFLFLKFLSDQAREQREILEKEFPNDPERVKRKLARTRFVIPNGHDFETLYKKREDSHIGNYINQAFEAIEENNKAKLDGVFMDVDFNSESRLGEPKERNRRLKSLLEDFHSPELDLRFSTLGNLELIGDVYEYLIERFASDAGKKAGEFYTPPAVSQLLCRLLNPKKGDKIYDPTCGSGSLLIKLGQHVGSDDVALYGQENNRGTWQLCRMNMYLHGFDSARLEWGDTLNDPKFKEGNQLHKFQVVAANPPFSLDKWGYEEANNDPFNRYRRGIPPKSKADFAFISHMIQSMTESEGRMGVVVPHGVLFRGGAEGRIRQALIEENLLDTVIGLPANLFFGTGIPAAILIFKKNRKEKVILFIDASREFEDGKRQNRLRHQDIEKIVSTFEKRKAVEKYAALATLQEIAENDYNLNIPRYVDTFEEEEEIDLKAVKKEIVTLEEELSVVRKKMEGYLKELGL